MRHWWGVVAGDVLVTVFCSATSTLGTSGACQWCIPKRPANLPSSRSAIRLEVAGDKPGIAQLKQVVFLKSTHWHRTNHVMVITAY